MFVRQKIVLVQDRNLSALPPLITVVDVLSRVHDVTVFTSWKNSPEVEKMKERGVKSHSRNARKSPISFITPCSVHFASRKQSFRLFSLARPSPAPKKSYHIDTAFFIHYGVMIYHHATCLRAYHQKERENRSFLHIITL